MSKLRVVSLFLLGALTAVPAIAQDEAHNQLGLTLGAAFIPDLTTTGGADIDFSNSLVFGVTYARRMTHGSTSLYFEIPGRAAGSHRVESRDANVVRNLATAFITPGLRANFRADSAVSPWISAGLGWGLYETAQDRQDRTAFTGDRFTHTTAIQVGGGVDLETPLRLLVPIGFRLELRDFYTLDTPDYGSAVDNGRRHNVMFAGGFTVSW